MRFKDRYKKKKSFHLPSIDLSIIAVMFILVFMAWGVAKLERSFVPIDKIIPVFTISKELHVMPIVEPKEKKDAKKIGDFVSLGRSPKKPLKRTDAMKSENEQILKNLVLFEKVQTSSKTRYPNVIYYSMPDYPVKAIEDSNEGLVIIKAYILKNGRVGNTLILKPSGIDILDKSAVSAISQWVFDPAALGRQPVEFYFNIPIRFRLSAD